MRDRSIGVLVDTIDTLKAKLAAAEKRVEELERERIVISDPKGNVRRLARKAVREALEKAATMCGQMDDDCLPREFAAAILALAPKPPPEPAPACPTCGGEGELDFSDEYVENQRIVPCPDCKKED